MWSQNWDVFLEILRDGGPIEQATGYFEELRREVQGVFEIVANLDRLLSGNLGPPGKATERRRLREAGKTLEVGLTEQDRAGATRLLQLLRNA